MKKTENFCPILRLLGNLSTCSSFSYLWGNSSCASSPSCKSSCGNLYEQCWDPADELKKKSDAIDNNLLAAPIKAKGVGVGCHNLNQGETCCKPGGLRLAGSTCRKGYLALKLQMWSRMDCSAARRQEALNPRSTVLLIGTLL